MKKVLNAALYKALEGAFGRPDVYRQGTTAAYRVDATTSLDAAGDSFGTDVKGGERYVVVCPFCGRKKLWLSYLSGAVVETDTRRIRFPRNLIICYRCLFNRDTNKVKQFWETIKENGYDGNGTTIEAASISTDGGEDAPPRPLKSPAEILPVCIPLTSPDVPTTVGTYLRGRGIDPGKLEKELGACWSDDPKQRGFGVGRIIFPVWQNHRLVGWQGRCLDQDVSPSEPKYWFPPDSPSDMWLYNMDRARWCDPGVLVEGVLDVYKVGPAGIGRFGKVTHTRQLTLLRAIWGTRSLVYLPDTNDDKAIDKAREEVANWKVRELFAGGVDIVYLPKNKDPGAMEHSELQRIIKEVTGKEIP